MTSIAALSSTVYDMIPKIGAIHVGVIGLAFVAEGYACYAKDNQPSSEWNYPVKDITIDLSKWEFSLLVGASRAVQVIAFLGSTQLFKSYWIIAPCALTVLVTSLPMTSSSVPLQVLLQVLNGASKSLRVIAKIVNSLAMGNWVQRVNTPEDPTECGEWTAYEENMAKFRGLQTSFGLFLYSLILEIDDFQKKPK